MRIFVCVMILLATLTPLAAQAQPMGPGGYRGAPYGQFCPGMRWGPYGARKPVRTAEEAKQVVEAYFSAVPQLKQPVHAGRIEEKRWYFEVEVVDRDGVMVDKTIVDKRTGRIRSVY